MSARGERWEVGWDGHRKRLFEHVEKANPKNSGQII